MIFSSIGFLIFFSIFVLLIKIFSNYQKHIIIILSLFFYSYWDPIFFLLIFYLLITTFYIIKKKISLKISIPIILLPLFYFKYSSFIFSLISIDIFEKFSYYGSLPLAISFITFTVIALIVDITSDKFNEELTFVNFAEFIMFFPQLIAGPILRAKELIPQLRNNIILEKKNIRFGLLLFLIGFVKKVFLADNISSLIDPFFQNPELYSSEDLIKGYLLFPFQIYFDFSGYVDMALGVSIFLGIKLPINFNKPYLTGSLTNFWRNWHITLSNWFRDYLYIPIGGSKKGNGRLFFNLIFTMSLAGLWHGANFNFVIWGFLNGLILYLEKILNINYKNTILKIIFNLFIIFNLWLIFRIEDISNLINYFYILYGGLLNIFTFENLYILVFSLICVLSQKIDNFVTLKKISLNINLFILIPIFIILIITGLAISTGHSDKFIYFDF